MEILHILLSKVHRIMWMPLLSLANTHRKMHGEDQWTLDYLMMHPSKRIALLRELQFPLTIFILTLLVILLAWQFDLTSLKVE